jgi:hypothetical protein
VRNKLSAFPGVGKQAEEGLVAGVQYRCGTARELSVGVVGDLFFDVHVFEFAGLEDFAALQALDVLSFFIA